MGIAAIIRLVPWGLALAGMAAAGFLFWRLGVAQERVGALEQANKAYAAALAAKAEATKSRAVTQQRVRQMAPAEKLEGLK
jgi:predicted TPR repeat methyltransferase